MSLPLSAAHSLLPFDRSAITSLISAMDNAVDEIWHTAKTSAHITGSPSSSRKMRAYAELACEAARLVQEEAIPLMRNTGRNAGRLHQITEAIVHLEGRGGRIYRSEGLTALYQAHGADRPIAFFVGRELYRYIERVLDRLQDVADEILREHRHRSRLSWS